MHDDGEWRNVWHGITVAPAARAIFPGSSSAPSSSKRMFFNRPLRSTGRGTRPRALYKDLAYFLIDLSWPRLALALATSYFGVIFLFGLLFFFICQECDNLFDGYNLSYQAFSTIGFGVVYSRDRCGNYVTILESYVSMVLLPTFAGIIFTKFSLPKVQVAFSNKCCIQPNYQGQHSALVVRVANASSSPNLNLDVIMDAVFTMELFSVHETVLRRHKLALKQSDFIFFRLALELVHVIDESSPLHGMPFTANCMLHVTVTGIDSNRHATIVNQMSYTSDRVAVGAKFDSMLSHDLATNHVVMDFEKLSCVVSVETCSIAPHMAAAAPGRTPTSSSSPEFVDASSPQHHDGVSWDQPEAELAAAATASDQPFVEPGMTGILFKDSSGRALHRQATMSDGGSYVHIDDTISMLHRVRPKNVPHRFQYLYYHILHAKWVSIVAGIFILTATVTVFFAVLHWVHFPGGLFLMADMLPPRNSPFELCMYLSVHTFSTIGYGTIAPAPGDNYHNALVAVEAMCGLTVATILTGIFWSKFALPQAHIQFSPAMAVSMYQSQRCLVFRAVNTRNVGDIQLCQFKLGAFSTDRSGARRMYDLPLVQPTWPSINMPATLVHVIDESSPLRRHNDDELNATSLLALFSGFDSTFCETVYARQIYTTYEFGKQFENSVTLTPDDVGVEWSQCRREGRLRAIHTIKGVVGDRGHDASDEHGIAGDGSVDDVVSHGHVLFTAETTVHKAMMGWRRGKVYVAAATDDDGAPPPPSSPRNDKRLGGLSNRVSVAVGLVYVVLSMACNVGYLVLLAPHASNDHWWRRFNVSGTQTFVADVFNAQLHVGHATGPVDLLSLTSTKAYDMATTFVDVRRSTARQYLLSPIAFSAAIDTIRRNGVAENLRVPTQYCWADLGRRFEMAHTAGRQRRCAASDKWTNAALVLASVLRNIDVRVLLASEYAAMLDHTVLHGIAGLSTAGQEWVDSIVWARNASVGGFVEATVEAEAAAWRAAGFTRWSLQLQNLVVAGFDESIDVVNALGMRQPFQIYHEATYSHTIAGWTTSLANPGFWNDLGTCESLKCSLVRGTPNSIDAMAIDWDVESNGPLPDGTGSGGSGIGVVLMHAHMGPYSSVDMELVAIPVSLAAYYDAFRRDLFAALGQDDRVATAFSAQVDRAVVDAAPWSRREYWFYGGNPMCPKGTRQPFVQPSFGFSDDCSKQIADGVALERMAVLFALATTAASSSRLQDDPQRGARLCALAATTAPLCEHALALASRTHDLLTPHWTSQTIAMKDTAVVDTMELQISTLQFATARNDTVARVPELLVQLVAGDGGSEPDASSLWPFFGWITLYEWLDGRREVFDFQGDVGRFKLMSAPLPFQSMVANPAQLPHSACKYVHYISIYVSMVLVGVAIVASMAGLASLCSTARSPGHLSHWIFFNRVVGSVWVGRPMLCIRGMTAVMVLATAPIDLVKSHGYTQLMSAPRSVGHVAVVAGEATWLSYVLSDILLPTMHSDVARVVAPLSALAAWTASVLLEVADPWQVRATLGRDTCHIQSFRHGVSCASGEIQVGSVHRVLALVLVQVGSTIVATCVAYVAGKVHHRVRQGDAINDKHVLVPGASAAFLHGSVDAADVVGCILSGILPTTTAFFDVKLWMPIAHSTAFHSTCPFRWPTAAPPPSSSSSAGRAAHRRWRSMASPALGLAYMMASVVSSYSFLDVTKSTMANDLWWVGFDTPGTHAYLANWFNQYLQVTDYVPTRIHLPDPKFAAIAAPNNATQTRIVASPMYSSAPHRGLSTLENVVAGLRRTPGCMLPWVFTPYCYVDFGKRWELAHSAARQLRCANMTDNGAVFLEAVLRNADWDGLMACWGHSLNVAVFADVQLTSDGQQWLTRVRANALTVADEVDVWSRLGIVAFTTQWQNFKRLGIDESFSIQNAFGVSYAMALKKSNGTLQFASQTSFQLYWSFASDLWAVAANSTRMGGRSLVRTSRDYAWYNVSLEDILLDNGTVDAPLTRSRSLVRAALGPFGTIDAKRIPCPESLRVAHQVGTEMLARTLSASAAAQDDFWGIYHTFNYSPMPQAWSEGAYGGSLLCDINSAASKQPCEFFTYKGGCSMFGAESTLGSTVQAVKSLLAVGAHEIARGWVESTCERELSERESCVTQLTDAIAFLAKHVSLDDMQTMSSLGSDAKAVVRDELQVDYVQFVSLPGASAAGMTLARENFFHSRDMEFFSWLLLWEWVDGKREVTLFHGDAGRICAMSTSDDLAMSPTSAMDIPLNVANYLRAMVQYTSLVLCAVAVVVSLYIVANRGRVEGINMLSFNRVCGLVWIGRPLLFIRGITALCVLSTASLELTRPHSGLVTFFQSKKPDWVATVLSSGEMTWLVYVVNDVASAYTQQFTGKSAMSSTIVAGLVALVWSAVVGVEPFVDLRRQCQWVHVDFQLTCTSGSVHIGRFDRFGGLLSVIVAACVVCYGVVRRSNPTLQPTTTSLLLHLSAKYHFRRRPWEFDGIYHLDRASAAMNGLVSVDWVHATFVLDVKVWRTYMVSKKETTPPPIAPSDPSWRHLHTALPLVQEHSIFDTP